MIKTRSEVLKEFDKKFGKFYLKQIGIRIEIYKEGLQVVNSEKIRNFIFSALKEQGIEQLNHFIPNTDWQTDSNWEDMKQGTAVNRDKKL